MRTFSYGGGVQSTAVLVLASQGKVQYDHFLFANVGEDSEHPDTLVYFKDVALPFAKEQSLDLIEVRKLMYRTGEIETVYGRAMGNNRSIPIPIRMSNGAPGRRSCTSDFKIRVIARWLKKNGATKEDPAVTGLGISIDEFHRARSDSGIPHQVLEYPLIDLRLSRQDCINIIARAGLPVPPRSACYFCPFHSRSDWIRLKNQRPDLFDKAVGLEKRLNEKRGNLQKDRVWMHPSCKPLDIAVGDQMMFDLDDMDNCESGYCFT